MHNLFLLSLLTAFSISPALAQDVQLPKRFQIGLIGGKTILGSYQHAVPWEKVGGGFAGFDVSYAFTEEDPNFTVHFQPNWETYRYQSPGEIVFSKWEPIIKSR